MKKTNLQKAIEIYNMMEKSFYWLEVMVKNGDINESEAGYIVLHHG